MRGRGHVEEPGVDIRIILNRRKAPSFAPNLSQINHINVSDHIS
jgi:hypothetical protein